MRKTRKIVVLGLGYIGLPTSSMLATGGHYVLGVDVNPRVVETINSGKIHIVEPDLAVLVRSAVNSGNLHAALQPEPADVFIIAVPTPFKKSGSGEKEPDLGFVDRAVESIIPCLRPGNLVILESTSPVGTTERVHSAIVAALPEGSTVHAAHCPERVLPGRILKELSCNDRVIGGVTPEAAERAAELYRAFCNGRMLLTDSRTAEMTKLVENTFRDVNIAFANELSVICDSLGINVWDVIKFANHHPRVNIMNPGPGVGGHCIAVDPWFLVSARPELSRLIRSARETNDSKPEWVIEKVREAALRFPKPVVGCLGLTFKANIDDIRESPSMAIAERLLKEPGWRVMPCDPFLENKFDRLRLYPLDEVLSESDVLVLLVDHDEFKAIDRARLSGKTLIDTRGAWC